MKIYFSCTLKRIEFLTRDLKGASAYLILTDNNDDISRIKLLLNKKGVIPVDKNTFLKNGVFKTEYVEFIASLNRMNRAFDWHALNLSSKSRLSFDFYYRLAYAVIIKNTLSSREYDNLILVSNDPHLARQVKIFSREGGHTFVLALRFSNKRYCLPLPMLFVFLRTLLYASVAKVLMRKPINVNREYYLLKTLLSQYSFDDKGNFKDIYFHRLIDYLNQKQIGFIVNATIFKPYLRNFIKIKGSNNGITIIPRETYLSYLSILRCFLRSLYCFFNKFGLKKNIFLHGVDVSVLVKSEICLECASKDYFLNLLEYYSMKAFVRNFKFNSIIYPFEHRSWESMLVCAVRESRFPAFLVGYQHTSIALKHTNFLFGKDEPKDAILPNKIVSMGKITNDIMKKYGNFPHEILEIGPALRQEAVAPGISQKNISSMRNILVAMTTDTDEYRKIMSFTKKAFIADRYFRIKIRPHPLAHLEGTLNEQDFLPSNMEFDYGKKLGDSLSWADIVFYSSSTVSIEALRMGIPIVYIDFGEDLCPDPLFELNDFKWLVSSPAEVLTTLTGIRKLPQDSFNLAKNKAYCYAREYLFPCNENTMAIFLKRNN